MSSSSPSIDLGPGDSPRILETLVCPLLEVIELYGWVRELS